MITVLAGALAAAVFTLLATYALHLRSERRMGGAAERQFAARLERAYRVLRTSDQPDPTWTAPGLRLRMEPEQWDRVVARFQGPDWWDEISRLELGLDVLQTAAERSPPAKLDPENVEAVAEQIEALLRRLDERQTRWLALRPRLKPAPERPGDSVAGLRASPKERHAQRRRAQRRALGVAAAIITLAGGVVGATVVVWHAVDDPITVDVVERELREMQPDARVVNCHGNDGRDRWTCITVADRCAMAATQRRACSGDLTYTTTLGVDADEQEESMLARILRQTTATPIPSPPRRSFVRRLFRREPPVDLVG